MAILVGSHDKTDDNNNNNNNNNDKTNGNKLALSAAMEEWLLAIPKVELHVHIEGTLEPDLVFALAKRNKIDLKFATARELADAYQFENLQSFLDLYYQACAVLLTQQDFYDMTMAYLQRSHQDNMVHVELFVDPQSHLSRGISMNIVMDGILQALQDAQSKWGITSKIIVCVLRHLNADDAMNMLNETLQYMETHPTAPIVGLGMDSSEKDRPPHLFTDVFEKARKHGLKICAHAGEEGPPSYIWEALDVLQVDRIDHGVRCVEDEILVERLVREQIPLTVCPHSNVKLCVFDSMKKHNLQQLLKLGLCASIHSDDPAYFGGYILDNYRSVVYSLGLDKKEIIQLAKNAIDATFLTNDEKKILHDRLEKAVEKVEN